MRLMPLKLLKLLPLAPACGLYGSDIAPPPAPA